MEFSDAVMGTELARLDSARTQLQAAVGDAGFHETAATVANFNQMDRIADSTGIPLDTGAGGPMAAVGRELGIDRFASAKNTLQRG